MTSSAASPFKLTRVVVRPANTAVVGDRTYYARFMLLRTDVLRTVTNWHDVLAVDTAAHLSVHRSFGETDAASEVDEFGALRGFRIGSIAAQVEFDPHVLLEGAEPSMRDAMYFAFDQINPMLESMTTLYGIEHNIDIEVEHRLRATPNVLRNLVQSRPTLRFNTKGRYNI